MNKDILSDLYARFIDNPIGRVILMILLEIVALSANLYIENNYILHPILKGIMDSIPTGLLSAAFISWILEAKDIREIISRTFKESIHDFTDFKLFSKDALDKIIKSALARFYG